MTRFEKNTNINHCPSVTEKKILGSAITLILFGYSAHVNSALPDGTVFSIDNGSFFNLGIDTSILGENQIVIGADDGDTGTGSHLGLPTPADIGAVTQPWGFFNNTGYDYVAVGSPIVDIASDQLDFTGWTVTWNGIPAIPMGGCQNGDPANNGGFSGCDTDQDGNDDFNDTSIATINWSGLSGDPYTLSYSAHVPAGDPSGFGGAAYALSTTGIVSLPGSPPQTSPDQATTILGNTINIDVLANDTSADGLDTSSVAIDTQAAIGAASPKADGTIDYDPQAATAGDNGAFTYTVDSLLGIPSSPTDVDVDIQANVAPTAVNDSAGTNTSALDNAGGMLVINVLKNDTDANNDPGLPGGIDVTKVNVLTQPSIGSCAANATTGRVTYSQALPSVTASTSCTYEVMDIDSFGTPLTSNVATVDIDVTALESDWPPSLDPDIIPFLIFDDGVPNTSGNTADVPESGTYFSMDVSANTTIYTPLTKGPDGGFIIGYDQLATGSHTGLPTGNETSSVDLGWNFFGNTGLTFTMNGGITGNTDGTLKFSGDNGGQGKYQITWNGIPEIDLGGSDQFPEDLGFALIECDPAPCADGSTYDMTYEAHVPPGDPSGFGGVQYRLVMNGTVAFLDGSFQTSSGTFSVEERSQAGDSNIEPDPDSEIQCAGGCFDYTITGVNGPSVSVVLPLNSGVPASTLGQVQLRVFREGAWGNFDTSGNDSVMSAPFTSGGDFGTTCPPPGDAAYGALTEGHQCLQVTIEDNGPNDKNGTDHEITDPSGLGIPTIVQGPDTRTSGTSGCTVASTTVSPLHGGAWWLLAGLASLIGWKRRQSKLH